MQQWNAPTQSPWQPSRLNFKKTKIKRLNFQLIHFRGEWLVRGTQTHQSLFSRDRGNESDWSEDQGKESTTLANWLRTFQRGVLKMQNVMGQEHSGFDCMHVIYSIWFGRLWRIIQFLSLLGKLDCPEVFLLKMNLSLLILICASKAAGCGAHLHTYHVCGITSLVYTPTRCSCSSTGIKAS